MSHIARRAFRSQGLHAAGLSRRERGAGKRRFAQRLAAEPGAPWAELDAIHHLADCEPIDLGTFYAVVDKIASTETWVINSDYRWWS